MAPVRAYQDYRANEAAMMRETIADPDGLGSVREYRVMMASADASMRTFAEGARQRNAARAQRRHEVEAASDLLPTPAMTEPSQSAAEVSEEPNTLSVPASTPDADVHLAIPVQHRIGGGGPPRRGNRRDLTPAQQMRMLRFELALKLLSELEPNNPDLEYITDPDNLPSEEFITRLNAEIEAAQMRAKSGEPPRSLGTRLPEQMSKAPDRVDPRAQERLTNALSDYRTQCFQIDNQTFLLTKSGMEHIPSRHSPEFFINPEKPTETQTLLPVGTTLIQV